MSAAKNPQSLLADQNGAAVIEFALLAPILITMLLGIFQIGVGMQNYSAVRSVSAEVARVAMINYQNANRRSDEWIEARATLIATSAPYNLTAANLTVDVAPVNTSRVSGTTEKSITVQYTVPSILSTIGMDDIQLSYVRPVFLIT